MCFTKKKRQTKVKSTKIYPERDVFQENKKQKEANKEKENLSRGKLSEYNYG